ncbi:MAG: ThiF family adenylyltransferase [Candidatus Microsaccharimonas sp.]
MSRISYADQLDIFDPDRWTWPVHAIGMGGIGSSIVAPLVKLGISELHMWDDDRVEPHNIPAQALYRPSDIGMFKVDAAQQYFVRQEAGCKIVVHRERVTRDTQIEGIAISGVDSMVSRHDVWSDVAWNGMVPLYMDGRIGGEKSMLLTVDPCNPEHVAFYEEWLFDDSEAASLPCAARTIIHSPQQIATWVTTNLTLFARGKSPKTSLMANLQGMQYAVSKS